MGTRVSDHGYTRVRVWVHVCERVFVICVRELHLCLCVGGVVSEVGSV